MFVIDSYMTEDLKLSGNELLVYAYICSNLNGSNECYKLQKTIAKNCGTNERTVLRAIKSLEEKKIIHITKHLDGKRRINVMHIQLKYVDMKSDPLFDEALTVYNTAMGLSEDKCNKNYTAYKFLLKDTSGDIKKFYDAVECYAAAIKNPEYYKAHIYSFETFTRKYRLYLPGGIEYVQFKTFLNNGRNRFNLNDSEIDPCKKYKSALIPDNELDNIKV